MLVEASVSLRSAAEGAQAVLCRAALLGWRCQARVTRRDARCAAGLLKSMARESLSAIFHQWKRGFILEQASEGRRYQCRRIQDVMLRLAKGKTAVLLRTVLLHWQAEASVAYLASTTKRGFSRWAELLFKYRRKEMLLNFFRSWRSCLSSLRAAECEQQRAKGMLQRLAQSKALAIAQAVFAHWQSKVQVQLAHVGLTSSRTRAAALADTVVVRWASAQAAACARTASTLRLVASLHMWRRSCSSLSLKRWRSQDLAGLEKVLEARPISLLLAFFAWRCCVATACAEHRAMQMTHHANDKTSAITSWLLRRCLLLRILVTWRGLAVPKSGEKLEQPASPDVRSRAARKASFARFSDSDSEGFLRIVLHRWWCERSHSLEDSSPMRHRVKPIMASPSPVRAMRPWSSTSCLAPEPRSRREEKAACLSRLLHHAEAVAMEAVTTAAPKPVRSSSLGRLALRSNSSRWGDETWLLAKEGPATPEPRAEAAQSMPVEPLALAPEGFFRIAEHGG